MEEKTSSNKTLIIGLLAGGTIGSIVALLFAPKSGRELRKDISKKSREVVTETGLYIVSAKTKAPEIIFDGMKKAESLIKVAKKKADSISKGTEKLYTQGKEFLTDETARIKEAVSTGVDTFKDEQKTNKKNITLKEQTIGNTEYHKNSN